MSFHISIIRSGATSTPAASVNFNNTSSIINKPKSDAEAGGELALSGQLPCKQQALPALEGIDLSRPFN